MVVLDRAQFSGKVAANSRQLIPRKAKTIPRAKALEIAVLGLGPAAEAR
jgi:hypothetical protein